jgi:hypothetical protein
MCKYYPCPKKEVKGFLCNSDGILLKRVAPYVRNRFHRRKEDGWREA